MRITYESEALFERNKLDQELLKASRVNNELKKENENLKNLRSACQKQMKSLLVVQNKRKDEKTSFNLEALNRKKSNIRKMENNQEVTISMCWRMS
jgi:FtsZ-binding cell division protein ZapB